MAALGINPLPFLRTESTLEQAMWIELKSRLIKLKEVTDHNLAVAIATQVGNLIKK